MENDKLQDPAVDHPEKNSADNTTRPAGLFPDESSLEKIPAAIRDLKTSQQRLELKTDAAQTDKSTGAVRKFPEYLKKNALALLILVVLLAQAVQIAHLRKSIDTLSGTMGVLSGTVNNSSTAIAELKSKLKEDKHGQIDLIRKLKAEYASGYEQILAKEKSLEQLDQTSIVQKIEEALERFWHKILAGFN